MVAARRAKRAASRAGDTSQGSQARGQGESGVLAVQTDGTLPIFAAAAGPGAWTLRVAVTPGGAKDVLAGLAEDRLRVRLRAKAVEGQANAALTDFLAACLGLRSRQVRLVAGEKSRKKTIRIEAESEPDWSAVAGMG